MNELHSVVKKLQFKDQGQAVLILNAPKSYEEVSTTFLGEVHREATLDTYHFVQVFGTSNEEIRTFGKQAAAVVKEDGLLWLCYPKKSSKTIKGSDCSRDTVATLLAEEGYEPVRQIAVDEDWSALRFRKVEQIKTLTRGFAVTEKGKERTQSEN
ncbi:DUF3052 domain-containing protein [Anaerobacillus alkaliphilus]|uniref:DUF3052 domain-containing protein n=1 Tax=Anaerobacillus alkaliphilus TaxID=1548597 RepID=A0A4V1LGE0_9BACI|nr:DUF3052 domain-containing protein [Anaerobacillus alkaliphilus]RXJ00432.1 DUF3052 domain-containing protein [Anaerobacillus alkaliphilus]